MRKAPADRDFADLTIIPKIINNMDFVPMFFYFTFGVLFKNLLIEFALVAYTI